MWVATRPPEGPEHGRMAMSPAATSQVWAYHPSRTASTPPASEWNVPHDGPIDPSFSVSMRWAAYIGQLGGFL